MNRQRQRRIDYKLAKGMKKAWMGTLVLFLFVSVAASSDVVDEDASDESTPKVDMEDDRTLLDMFGEVAKEYVTQRVIPETDAECKWDWRYARCQPFCDCAFIPLLGDYHLGRSCRRITKEDDEWCHLPPSTPYTKIVVQSIVRGKLAVRKTRVALDQVAQGTVQKWQQIQEQTCACKEETETSYLFDDTYTMRRSTLKERILCGGPVHKRCNNKNDTLKEDDLLQETIKPSSDDALKKKKWMGLWT